jgi:hypothetical protein
MVSDEVCAYAAGLFDAEGHIGIAVVKASWGDKWYHRLQIALTNTDRRAPDWLKEHFGGNVGSFQNPSGRARRSYRWQMASKPALEFLRLIQPYSVGKAEEIDIALEFGALGATRGRTHATVGAPAGDIYERREGCRQRLMAIHRGKAVAP